MSNTDDLVGQILSEGEPGAMATRWVLIAEGIDTQGDRALYTAMSAGLKTWEALGMLSHAVARQTAQIMDDGGEDV